MNLSIHQQFLAKYCDRHGKSPTSLSLISSPNVKRATNVGVYKVACEEKYTLTCKVKLC